MQTSETARDSVPMGEYLTRLEAIGAMALCMRDMGMADADIAHLARCIRRRMPTIKRDTARRATRRYLD